MASKWVTVTCPDECARLAKAGLLYWRWPNSSEWVLSGQAIVEVWFSATSQALSTALAMYGEHTVWPPCDFGYLVDAEDGEDVSS